MVNFLYGSSLLPKPNDKRDGKPLKVLFKVQYAAQWLGTKLSADSHMNSGHLFPIPEKSKECILAELYRDVFLSYEELYPVVSDLPKMTNSQQYRFKL